MPPVLIDASTSPECVRAVVEAWVAENVPVQWREAADRGGPGAIREVRSYAEYERWYPAFAASGLAVSTWPASCGGLGLTQDQARVIEAVLGRYNLGRHNIIGLGAIAPALFGYGTVDQRRQFLPPMVRNEQIWTQLLSEPGAGSDLASLATRAVRDGDDWVITGQKVWSTWAHRADFANCLARTDPGLDKRTGLTYFLIDMHAPGVTVCPLRHIAGEIEFNEVFLDAVRVPDAHRVGAVGDGWRVVGATLSGERAMVSGAGSGGVDRIGGSGVDAVIASARQRGLLSESVVRQRIVRVYCDERIRQWTNERVRQGAAAGRPLGPVSSVGKVHQASVNQALQMLAVDVLGMDAVAWAAQTHPNGVVDAWAAGLPRALRGMLRSRANTIEGGTSEVNRTVLGERVLGLPRERDPFRGAAWSDVPRSAPGRTGTTGRSA
jgi:alkylation response protein AidB-like acyl-CoA dehydrogenase